MKLQYLGTAAAEGVPGLFCQCAMCQYARKKMGKEYRARSGAVINDRIMIDFPPDAYSTCLRTGINLPEIQHILFTHSHSDHCCASELQFRSDPVYCIRTDEESLHLYGNHEVQRRLEKVVDEVPHLAYTYLEPFVTKQIGDLMVTPLLAFHNPPEKAYLYLLEQSGKRLLYAHDTGLFPQETLDFLKGKPLDLVSMDCTCGVLPDNGGGHMSLGENKLMKEKLSQQGCAHSGTIWVINHFSHNGLRWTADQTPVTMEQLEELHSKLALPLLMTDVSSIFKNSFSFEIESIFYSLR